MMLKYLRDFDMRTPLWRRLEWGGEGLLDNETEDVEKVKVAEEAILKMTILVSIVYLYFLHDIK
jgi:hypothetical protein